MTLAIIYFNIVLRFGDSLAFIETKILLEVDLRLSDRSLKNMPYETKFGPAVIRHDGIWLPVCEDGND